MRTKEDILNEINKAQILCNKLIMAIGQDYIRIRLYNEDDLIVMLNQKIDAYKTEGEKLLALERELAKTT